MAGNARVECIGGDALCVHQRKHLNVDTLKIEKRTDLEIDVNVDGIRSLFDRDIIDALQGQLVEAKMIQQREQQRDQHRQMALFMQKYYDQQQVDAKKEKQQRIERLKGKMDKYQFPKPSLSDCRLRRKIEGDIFKSFRYKRAFETSAGNDGANSRNDSFISYNVLNMQTPASPDEEKMTFSKLTQAAVFQNDGFL